jgi:predicted DCC family thiol-disulfide oxidoreductase YuxK
VSQSASAASPGTRGAPLLFYDGECGVCHLAVRFLLWADPEGEVRFAPLGGESFHRRIPADERRTLPDSLVLVTTDGRILTRSTAVLALLDGMGGLWRVAGWLVRLVPRPLADVVYDGIARIRKRLAPKPSGACPVVAEPLRSRFDV